MFAVYKLCDPHLRASAVSFLLWGAIQMSIVFFSLFPCSQKLAKSQFIHTHACVNWKKITEKLKRTVVEQYGWIVGNYLRKHRTWCLLYTGWCKKRGHPISLQIFWKLRDRIAWKLVNFCNIICWTQSLTFLFKNFIALWRHLCENTATVWCSNLFVQCE